MKTSFKNDVRSQHTGRRFGNFAVVAAVASIRLLSSPASAQTWDGGSGQNINWSTAANWAGDVAPANNGTATVTLTNVGSPTSQVDVPWSIQGLRAQASVGIGGAALTIGSGGITLGSPQPNTFLSCMFSNTVVLNASQTWSIAAGSDNNASIFAGAVDLGSHTLSVRPAVGDVRFEGKITGAGRLVIGEIAYLYPAGSDYSGGTTVESTGHLIGFPTSIRGNITVSPGGIVRFTNFLNSNIDNNANKDGTFRGTFSGGGTVNIRARIGFDPADSEVVGAEILLFDTLEAAAPGSLSFGPLIVASSAAKLNMNPGASAVSFADSYADSNKPKYTWSGTLTVTNYELGTDTLRFGTSNLGLHSDQLSHIVFADYDGARGKIDENGFVTPVTSPQPGGPPVMTSPTSATSAIGQSFIYQITASNEPTSYTAANLPPGLEFDRTLAVISGTPEAAGTYQIFIGASNPKGSGSAMLKLTVQEPPAEGPTIISSTAATGRTGAPFRFQVITRGGSAATTVEATDLPAGLVIDSVTGLISGTPEADGSSAVQLTATDGGASATATLQLTFTSDPAVPVITSSSEASLAPGEPFTYTIEAPTSTPDDPVTYSIMGDLLAGLSFDPSTGTISGTPNEPVVQSRYGGKGKPLTGPGATNVQLFAKNSRGTATIPLVFFLAPKGVVNIATRLAIQSGANVLIGGFIITGDAPKRVLIRAIAPSLGFAGALDDPTLQLREGENLIGENDDWRSTQEQEINATTIPPGDNREAALLATLPPRAYTAIVAGKDGSAGIGLVEVYDLGNAALGSTGPSKLANLSTRGFVQTENDVMIGGFIVSGDATKVIVRAVGPSLTSGGVAGALADTTLDFVDGNGALIVANDDWRTGGQEQQIIDTTVPPQDNRESAVVATINPGGYTAVVRGKNNTTGVALVEVYVLE